MNRRIKEIASDVKHRLNQARFLRSIIILAGGTTIGQVFVVLASPIVTRLYTPADFGALGVYLSILSMVAVLATFRYELAICLPSKDGEAVNLVAVALLAVVGVSLTSLIGVLVVGDTLVQLFHAPLLQSYLWLIPLGVAGEGTYQALTFWAIRKQAYTSVARTGVFRGLTQVIAQVGMGLVTSGPLGLISGDVVGRSSGSGFLIRTAWLRDRRLVGEVSLLGLKRVLVRYWRFPVLSSWSGLLNNAGLQLPTLLLAAWYGAQVAGWFSLGQRVIALPIALIGRAVSQAYFGETPRLARDDPYAMRSLFRQTAKRLLMVGVLPIGLLAFAGPHLFTFVFGGDWGEAGRYTQLLALMFLVQFVVSPLSQTLNILERQDWQLMWDAVRVLLVTGSILLPYMMGWPAQVALVLYGTTMIAAYLVHFILSDLAISNRINGM